MRPGERSGERILCLSEPIAVAVSVQMGGADRRQPPSCEFRGEFPRLWRAERDWQRQAQLEPESQALVKAEFVDVAASDLPAEVDLSALPRWMRAVLEHGPPDELEFEAGRGPAEDWD